MFMVAKNILVEKMSYEVDYLGIVSHGFEFDIYTLFIEIISK